MRIERIDDHSDPRVAAYRDLKDAQLRLREGLFVAESRTVVARLLAGGRFRTQSILLTQPALEELCDLLDGLAPHTPVYLTRPEVVRSIVGYNFHRGCLALGERGVEPPLPALLGPPGPRLLLLLDELSDPDNVGGVFRNAMAFGADAVLLSQGCADPLYRKAIRVSVGASLCVPFARLADWAAALRRLRESGYTLLALTPRARATDIARLAQPLPGRIALAFGSEGQGLRPETLSAADVEVWIPMAPGIDSLNVATASGIALHRVKSAKADPGEVNQAGPGP